MASVDLEMKGENDTGDEPASAPRLAWDASAGASPLGHGWGAEPVGLDWAGDGGPAPLGAAGGGPGGRTARLSRPSSDSGHVPRVYDAGTPVEALDGLRGLCPIPNGGPTRFDLVALAEEGLVLLRNEG